MENMVIEVPSKVRFVRCPKCRKLLPEPPGVPLYSCGGCCAILQAKQTKTSDAGRRTRVDPKDLLNAIKESRREEDAVAAAPEEESAPNEAAMKTENQSAAVLMEREESSCSEKTEETQDDNRCHSQSLSLESGGSSVECLGLDHSMEAATDMSSSSISIANIEHTHEGNEAKENGCCSNQSLQIEEDTAAMGCISVPHFEPQVEEEQNRNCDDEAEAEATVAGNVGSDEGVESVDRRVADSNVSTSDSIIIEQEAAQNDGSNRSSGFNAEGETAEETIGQENTSFGVRYQDLTKVGVINESESRPTRRTRNEQLELEFLRSGEETFFISEKKIKLREEMLLLNHRTPNDDSVSEMLMIKGLNPVRGIQSESYDQWDPRYAEGPLKQERKKFMYSSSLQSEQEKTELMRIMVLQLEEQVRRLRHSEAETVSVERNHFYSGTLNHPRNQFSQPYFSPSFGFSSPQQPKIYYSPSPSWDFETKSVDLLSNNSKFFYEQRDQAPIHKRHVRAVAGGSPVVTCYRCSSVLQLPEDFLLSKRKRFHWLKCGSCSAVLRFSLQNGTHIVPSRVGGGGEENSNRKTESARPKRGSALHMLMGYSSVTQLVIGSGESSPSDQTSV